MPSPFPGMDPYLEAQGSWESFHAMLIPGCAEALNRDLPEDYVAQVEKRITLVGCGEPDSERIPDVLVARTDDRPSPRQVAATTNLATLEPTIVPLARREVEVRERWIEIAKLPDLELVTVIEILSPSNRTGTGRSDYLSKRAALIDRPVHWVEIDLLLDGARMPMARRLPAGDYYATVARVERRPDAEVYAWTVRHPLPTLPIPLRAPDSDVRLNLAEVVATTYDRGGFARIVRQGTPLPASLPLGPDDRVWAEGRTR